MRLFSLILALILCASLIACGSGKDGEQSFDTETTSEETAEETTKADTDSTETEADTEVVQLEKLPYYAIADSDIFGDALADLADMVREKYNKDFAENGSGGIRLTSEGSTDNLISVTLEENELVIRATDAESMKKAVTCFWFENVEYADGDFAPKASFSYSKDLSRTVFYSDFNVKQSESECCIDALIAAHDHANANGYKVFADYGASYYISSIKKTVKVQTDVEWGNARFTIDDSAVANEDRGNWIFNIASSYSSYKIDTLKSISRDAESVELTFPQKSLIVLLDGNTRQYFRKGHNNDKGQTKRDLTVVNTDGSLDPDAPLMWDFDSITDVTVYPIDSEILNVSGGVFTTIANTASADANYYARGINISRSSTNLKNVTHLVVGDENPCAPYSGFVNVNYCAYVNVENCLLTGRKTHNAGTYDIGGSNMVSVTFKNCTQTNDINDTAYWGIMGTNYCKNLVYDGCVLSRFDTHKGVTNATIKNSTIGHGGISVTGYGTLLLENTVSYASQLINLRYDYGSSWEGDIIIKNCTLMVKNQTSAAYLILVNNSQDHDFGYTCYMPENVIIDGLSVNTYAKTYVFQVKGISETTEALYPYVPTKKVSAKNLGSIAKQNFVLCINTSFLSDTVLEVE